MVRVIMLSPPGAGKGTQSALLAEHTGVRHVSVGEVLRTVAASGGALGEELVSYTSSGDLVPDNLVLALLLPAVKAAVEESGGYILDGFPRTHAQAVSATKLGAELGLSATAVVYLDAPAQVLIDRLLARSESEGRADDTPAVIAHRLEVFAEQTRPLVEYYRGRGLLLDIDADRPADVVQDDVRTQLGVMTR